MFIMTFCRAAKLEYKIEKSLGFLDQVEYFRGFCFADLETHLIFLSQFSVIVEIFAFSKVEMRPSGSCSELALLAKIRLIRYG